jgi:hypothetical protein
VAVVVKVSSWRVRRGPRPAPDEREPPTPEEREVLADGDREFWAPYWAEIRAARARGEDDLSPQELARRVRGDLSAQELAPLRDARLDRPSLLRVTWLIILIGAFVIAIVRACGE